MNGELPPSIMIPGMENVDGGVVCHCHMANEDLWTKGLFLDEASDDRDAGAVDLCIRLWLPMFPLLGVFDAEEGVGGGGGGMDAESKRSPPASGKVEREAMQGKEGYDSRTVRALYLGGGTVAWANEWSSAGGYGRAPVTVVLTEALGRLWLCAWPSTMAELGAATGIGLVGGERTRTGEGVSAHFGTH